MKTFSGALISAGVSCLCMLIFRLLLPGHGGLGSLFIPENEPQSGSKLGGVFLLPSIIAGMLAGGSSLTGTALFSLLITAGSVLIGFADDLIARQDKHEEGIAPWLKGLLLFVLALSASIYLAFSNVSGRTLILPVSRASLDFKGWYLLPALPLLLGRMIMEKPLHEASGCGFTFCGIEAVFWCFVFCISAETGALQWKAYRTGFEGMAGFSGAVAGSLLGGSVFNPFLKALNPGMSGYYGTAVALSLMALCSGWLILLPLSALWPFICCMFALTARSRKDFTDGYLLADYFLKHGMSLERLQSFIYWVSLLGILAAAVLYIA